MKQFPAKIWYSQLEMLFEMLNTDYSERSGKDEELEAFPYVNGGLFDGKYTDIPAITEEIKELILNEGCSFNWRDINPTIFGAVFESTLNPTTRRKGGMHYTSIENIHKIIDPLFLDDLKTELHEIKKAPVAGGSRTKRMRAFQEKLASLTFLDPACGSGNFLTETYISLRKLENEVIQYLYSFEKGQFSLGMTDVVDIGIRVSISQFFGIEINDFAVSVAKTAMWIAEAQMLREARQTSEITKEYLPLTNNAYIIEANALQIDWESLVPRKKLNYIMGNPPFVGQALRTKAQAEDMARVFMPSKNGGKLDYVAGWFKKAADYTKNTSIETAFVASNSICQGESVNLLWEMLLEDGVCINFAYTTFKWKNAAKDPAGVSCVIVGFSHQGRQYKYLFSEKRKQIVNHINGYLLSGADIFIRNRSKSINKGKSKVVQGSPPADDGRLLLSRDERDSLLNKYPELADGIREYIGSKEFLHEIGINHYCIWFEGLVPSQYIHIPELMERFNYIREYRKASPVDRIRKTADRPYLFTQNRQPSSDYLLIPRHSSENRVYIPVGFMPATVIANDSVVIVSEAGLYEFGIITSIVHNAWMRTVAGRLESRYRYSPSVFYNFPFPALTEDQKKRIENTSQAIIDARKLYPDNTLHDMYGEKMYMFPELVSAHKANDLAVLDAYGMTCDIDDEPEIVSFLMKLYQEKVEEAASKS